MEKFWSVRVHGSLIIWLIPNNSSYVKIMSVGSKMAQKTFLIVRLLKPLDIIKKNCFRLTYHPPLYPLRLPSVPWQVPTYPLSFSVHNLHFETWFHDRVVWAHSHRAWTWVEHGIGETWHPLSNDPFHSHPKRPCHLVWRQPYIHPCKNHHIFIGIKHSSGNQSWWSWCWGWRRGCCWWPVRLGWPGWEKVRWADTRRRERRTFLMNNESKELLDGYGDLPISCEKTSFSALDKKRHTGWSWNHEVRFQTGKTSRISLTNFQGQCRWICRWRCQSWTDCVECGTVQTWVHKRWPRDVSWRTSKVTRFGSRYLLLKVMFFVLPFLSSLAPLCF